MHGCSRQKVKQVKTFHGIGNGLKCIVNVLLLMYSIDTLLETYLKKSNVWENISLIII